MTLLIRNAVLTAMLALVALAMALVPCKAFAKRGDPAYWCTTTMPAALPLTVNQLDVSVLRDLPAGSPIPGTRVQIDLTMQCKAGAFDTTTNNVVVDLYTDTVPSLVPGFTNIYTWSGALQGVGLRILNASGQALPIGPVPAADCTHPNAIQVSTGTNSTTTFKFTGALELVKTGNTVASGSQSITFRPGVCGQVWGNQSGEQSDWTIATTISKPAATTCTVANSSISVTMPTVSGTAMSSVGDVSAPTSFQIGLNCSAGATLFMTLTDNSAPSNTSDKLTATPDSTAKGVALQVFRTDGTTVSYGPDSSLPGTTNQHLIGATPNGALQIPFTVKYLRTGAVSAGSLNGKATFTLSYQ
ncbi:fimbrial protein [Dyella marensis]|uniref:Pilin (Type 1 fimbria component protein) n=1 Tax=Dyella marensis TaxID=500610 RepID=A0A1I2I2I3_9GAMM|nr:MULTISPECIES: fimbrial protein [Dyella]SFF35878.1 Pilin (type 1 fimbria component protein) [Dyella marensis]